MQEQDEGLFLSLIHCSALFLLVTDRKQECISSLKQHYWLKNTVELLPQQSRKWAAHPEPQQQFLDRDAPCGGQCCRGRREMAHYEQDNQRTKEQRLHRRSCPFVLVYPMTGKTVCDVSPKQV